ncbi:hypothetical protein LCGC14_0506830 [marine sediment metagenome]|uniref:SF4 helicase domain-containing protein n=1 Tax=marine sediment metagenome TaxID=412755 RepID=A0A0F9VAX7_9ZZZZ
MSIYPYNRQFRLKIISLCLDDAWMSRTGSVIISPDYFESDDEIEIVTAILEYYKLYKQAPTDPDDITVLCNGEYGDTIYTIFEEDYDLHLAKDVAVQWAREQAAKIAILESIDDVKRGRLAQVLDRIEEAVSVGDDLAFPGIDVIDDIDIWLYQQWIGKIKTGWPHVDIHLGGGLAAGELGIILGPSNRGKSMALVNIAYGAASIGSGKNVVIFTHEMSYKVYAKRLAARMLFRFPTVGGDLTVYEADVKNVAKKLMPGKIRIIGGMRMTTNQIEVALDRMIAEGYDFQLIIDDYPDLVIPPRFRKERRFEITETYEWFRRTAEKYNVPVWGASQANRAAYRKEVVSLEDIAEDIGKVNLSDIVVALCQTRKEEEKDRCRLFLAKVRDGVKGAMFDAKYYPRQQAIITTGITKRREKEIDA